MAASNQLNQHAEISVVASIMKYPALIDRFDALVAEDFTHPTFRAIFERMRELASAGLAINPASVNWDDEEKVIKYGFDWDEDFAALVATLKEDSFRRDIYHKLDPTLSKSYAEMSTPRLVELASENAEEARARAVLARREDPEQAKGFEKEAKEWQAFVDRYAPVLGKASLEWDALQTTDDVLKQQGTSIAYIVEEIIPKHRITMLFGKEKSGKSVIALDLETHVANGKTWLNRKVVQTPCIYIDYEDGILGSYIAWLRDVGEEKVRMITLRSDGGIPALDDPALLALCAQKQPLIVLDSLHKIFSREKGKYGSAWQSSDFEPVLEKIRKLCVAGATVILLHHSTKQDDEQYRDSSAIGANVDFLFAVKADEPANGVTRWHLKGQPSRGAQPPTVHILAFPHIIEQGHLCVDAGLEEEEDSALLAAKEVQASGPAKNKTALAKRLKGKEAKKYRSIEKAIELGWLMEGESGEIKLGSKPFPGREVRREVTAKSTSGSVSGSDYDNVPY